MNVSTSSLTSVSGSTVGVASPRTAVSGNSVAPAGGVDGSSSWPSNVATSCASSVSRADCTSRRDTRVNSSRVPPSVADGLLAVIRVRL